jgi:hypothetical protein
MADFGKRGGPGGSSKVPSALEMYVRKRCETLTSLLDATHDQLATVAFAAVFLLKVAMLYPNTISLPTLNAQVPEVAHVLSSECHAERYALTLKLMLANFRRKSGAMSTVPGTPRALPNHNTDQLPTRPGNGTHAMGELRVVFRVC